MYPAAAQQQNPNVVFILADNVRYGDLWESMGMHFVLKEAFWSR